MQAEIIAIGDELLIGQVTDTNSGWIAIKLNEIGIKVRQIRCVPDLKEDILAAFESAVAEIVIITGGLGPTRDDLTKDCLCSFFNSKLVFNEGAYQNIERLFAQRGKSVSELNRKQAELPEKCIALMNFTGTASGMMFKEKGKIWISLPGVPSEMKGIMEMEVLPRIQSESSNAVVHRTILTQGIAESDLSELIRDWELNLPSNLKLAYLPAKGMVRLRLSGTGENKVLLQEQVNAEVENILPLITEYVFGFGDSTLEQIVGKLLKQKNKTLSLAESCTGGYIAHLITSVPGCSTYFKGSVVAYSNEIKTDELSVNIETIERHGAVSEETVKEMAAGITKKFNTDFAIACSGIAGPEGGSEEKPVGMVWLAIAGPGIMHTKLLQLGGSRKGIITETALYALNALRKQILLS